MKTIRSAVSAAFCAAAVCLSANSQTQSPAGGPTDQLPADLTPPPATADSSAKPADGLRFRFKGTPLQDVLSYLSKEAGFVVYLRPGVSASGAVDAWSEQPISASEAVNFLKNVLSDHDLSVIQEGRTLTVLRTADATTETQIKIGARPELIPRDAEVVTQIIPVRSLNPIELGRILPPLLPVGTRLEVNESANSILLTDSQANVRRVAEIIGALDSVSATANTLKVYPVKYADAKELSGLIKELYAPADAGRGNGNGAAPTINFTGRRGGPGALNGLFNGNTGGDAGTTPQSRVAATADEHANALIVSAPETLLPDIDRLVSTLDVPVADETDTEVFHLSNADCVEMANELSQLFPDDDSSSDASGRPIQFNGQGIRGAQAAGARPGTTSATGDSSRMQKLGRVLVVPDPRTSSVLVSAAQTLMPAIANMITRLDDIQANRQKTFVIPVEYADLYEVQQMIQSIYPSLNNSAASSTTTDPLELRRTALFNSMFSTGPGSGQAMSAGSAFGAATGRGGQ